MCGLSSLHDIGDCVDPTSTGNLAYQGANAISPKIPQTLGTAAGWVHDHPLVGAAVCVATDGVACIAFAVTGLATDTAVNAEEACSPSDFITSEAHTLAPTVLGRGLGKLGKGLGLPDIAQRALKSAPDILNGVNHELAGPAG